jgi:hypothetical protein
MNILFSFIFYNINTNSNRAFKLDKNNNLMDLMGNFGQFIKFSIFIVIC